MKKIFCVFFTIIETIFLYSQIGINTTEPQSFLDVRGSLRIRKDLNIPLSSDDLENTTPGNNQQYLISQGADKPPIWQTFPTINYGIGETILVSDESQGAVWNVGASTSLPYIDGNGTFPVSFDDNASINEQGNSNLSKWTVLDSFEQNINVTENNTILYYNLQSVVQLSSYVDISIAVIAIGVFIDGQLKSIRTVQVTGANYTFIPINLMDALTINPKSNNEPYKLQLAARLRYFGTLAQSLSASDRWIILGVGIDFLKNEQNVNLVGAINTTSFMNGVHLALTIYEPNSLTLDRK